jgi:hypothetical protein
VRASTSLPVLLVVSMLAAGPASGDERHGAVAGRVTDHTGAPLPGVMVQVDETTTYSSGEGTYRVDGVTPGSHRLTFTLVGFAQHSRDGVVVTAGRLARVDASLQVALHTEVTVTGRGTFRNLAEIERPEANLVGFAASASEGAVTARQLEARPVQRSGEIVEAVPGLAVTQHSGEGKANQYYLRGFNLDHGTDFSTVLAGVPLNLPTHAHGHGYTDANLLIPELVTGVQYFKGPYAADAGDFSSAGGVNINYASVLPAPMLRVSAGGFGWARVFAAASPRVAAGHLLAAAEAAHNDGPWANGDDYVRHNAVLRYTRGDAVNNLALTALAYRARWNATDQAPRRAVASGLLPRFAGIDPTSGGETSRYSASADWQRGDASARTRVAAYAVASDLGLYSNFTYFLDDPINGDQFQQVDRRLVSGVRASHQRLDEWWGRPVEYRAGLQLRRDDIALAGLYRTRARRRLSTVREDAVAQTSVAGWGDASVRWNGWLRSVTGARVDGYRFDVASQAADRSATNTAALVSPKGSLIAGPWRGTELYLNGGFGFHSNDARADVTPLVRTRGAEVGARTVLVPGVQSTLALWRLALDSELVFVGDAGTTAASRPSERHGVEWSAFVSLGRAILLDADAAWSRARFTDRDPAGAHVPGAAERIASLGISVSATRQLFGSLRWRYFGSRPLVEDNSVRSRGAGLVNAQVGLRLSRRLSLIADAFNLLNARQSDADYFYTSRLPGEPDAGVDDVHTHPALPRTARITFQVGF